jgi:enamine deaminase RidA (YjgF/YER057c/UK114 family)
LDGTGHRRFGAAPGGTEHFIAVAAEGGLDFAAQIDQVQDRYRAACAALGLGPGSAVFRRVFISDAMNQAGAIRSSALAGDADEPVALSLVQQPPLPSAKLALLAYHIAGDSSLVKRRLSRHDLIVEKQGRRHLWTTGLCAGEDRAEASAAGQTRAVFGALVDTLAGQGATLRDHCIRTWIYLKDVDVFYQGMVDSRGAVFAEQGLTGDTHFIASTGIEGACAHRWDLVAMDAYSQPDIEPHQISYLNDFSRLCPTRDYRVHFERGTRIAYADRAHLFISGTASIDRLGRVVHPGDVVRQLDHAIDNVEALLKSGGAALADLMQLTVYLRDPTDFARIDARLAERFPALPVIIVQGAVCRPQWLVEIEGIAIAAQEDPSLPAF